MLKGAELIVCPFRIGALRHHKMVRVSLWDVLNLSVQSQGLVTLEPKQTSREKLAPNAD